MVWPGRFFFNGLSVPDSVIQCWPGLNPGIGLSLNFFLFPARDFHGIVPCVAPLYYIFSWHHLPLRIGQLNKTQLVYPIAQVFICAGIMADACGNS